MKKILKSSPPNKLTTYETTYPTDRWNNFRDYNAGSDYQELKTLIFKDQGELCAYCETKIESSEYAKQRVEHFNDKSNSTPTNNLHLQWDNVFGVCLGGQNKKGSEEYKRYPSPENLSCDAYKAHKKISHLNILNPLDIPFFPNLFELDRKTCELKANSKNCSLLSFIGNPYSSTEEFVTKTIENLNLNCDRLSTNRHEILISYNKEISEARRKKDRAVFKKITSKWFSKKHPSYFTTRRILLGIHAENFLKQNNYNG